MNLLRVGERAPGRRLRFTSARDANRGRRRRDHRARRGAPPGRAAPGRHRHGAREGERHRDAPDRAQQRRRPCRHLLRARLAQGPALPPRCRAAPRVLRRAEDPLRGMRQARRGRRRVRARPPAGARAARDRERRAGHAVARGRRAARDRATCGRRRRAALPDDGDHRLPRRRAGIPRRPGGRRWLSRSRGAGDRHRRRGGHGPRRGRGRSGSSTDSSSVQGSTRIASPGSPATRRSP